jgi:hypothetical protein
VKQQDGTELAKQIMIFPADLRGAAEGRFIMGAAPGASTQGRMTNGSVFRPPASRMTNGSVEKGSRTSLVVRYQEGSQTISVPPNVPVTEIVPEEATLTAGDTVYAATTTQSNGTLRMSKIFLWIPAAQ